MMKFKGTIIFAIFVSVVAYIAMVEFKKSKDEEEAKATKNNIVLNYAPSDVVEFSFKSSDNAYVLKRVENKWTLVEPTADNADAQLIDTTISELFSQSVEALDDGEKNIDTSKFGFDQPLGVYGFKFTDNKNLTLSLGHVRSYDKGYYIQKSESAAVWVGSSGWENLISKKAEDFRSKKLNLENGELARLDIRSQVKGKASALTFEKIDGKWIYLNSKNLKLQDSAITDYFNSLHQLKADAIVSDTSEAKDLKKINFTKPDLTIDIKISSGDNKFQVANISFRDESDRDAYLISSANKPIYKIAKNRVNEFHKILNDFRDKKYPFAFNNAAVESVEIKKEQAVTNLNGEEVKKISEGLLKLEAKEFLGSASKMAPNKNQILVKSKEGELIFKMNYELSKGDKDEYYRVVTNLSDEAMLVAKTAVDELVNAKKAQ